MNVSRVADVLSESWFDASGRTQGGPFVVADRGVGPLITERGHLVVYDIDNMETSQSEFTAMYS